jgi:hypothetical protein
MAAAGGLIAKGISLLPKILPIVSGIVGGGEKQQQQQQQPQIPQMPQMSQGVYDMGQQMPQMSQGVYGMGQQMPQMSQGVYGMGQQMPQMGRELINTGMNAFGGIRNAFKSGDYGGAIEQGIQGAGDMFQQRKNLYNKRKGG